MVSKLMKNIKKLEIYEFNCIFYIYILINLIDLYYFLNNINEIIKINKF
jgi:hypothetical protein